MPAAIEFGLDYSARELSPGEIDAYNRANPSAPITFLIRYIGYPGNRKCISAYPGALEAHERSGRKVLLVHQVAYQDFAGGYNAGVQHARLAVADAERCGWKRDRPIFAALDRYMAASDPARGIYPISLQTCREYVAGFRSILGDLAGLYGFYDVLGPAVREQWVRWFWQCGAESALVPGVQFYQWNNGRVHPGGMECDLNKSYVDLDILGGEDDVSFSEPVTNHSGKTFKAGQWLTWANEYAAQGAANSLVALGKLDAMASAIAAIAHDQDITPESMRQIVDDAVKANSDTQAKLIAAQTVTALRLAVREEMGSDNEAQADAIVDAVARRLAGAQ